MTVIGVHPRPTMTERSSRTISRRPRTRPRPGMELAAPTELQHCAAPTKSYHYSYKIEASRSSYADVPVLHCEMVVAVGAAVTVTVLVGPEPPAAARMVKEEREKRAILENIVCRRLVR